MEHLSIITNRFRIRNLKLSDLKEFHVYRSNPEVTKYQGFDIMNMEQAEAFLSSQMKKQFGKPGEWVQYGIEHKISGKVIGDCAVKLDRNDSRIAEIGLTISHLEQQKGYAKEVLASIITFLFKTKGILRIVEITDVKNTASINLLKSLGFRQEGHFIENVFFKGQWGSEFQFALLKREWDDSNS